MDRWNIKQNIQWMKVLVVFLGLGLLLQWVSPEGSFALTVEEYCLVAEKLLEISIQELEERKATGPPSGQNQTLSYQQSGAVTKKYRRKRDQLFATYGTTMEEYLRYRAEHNRKVNVFLEHNPDRKNAIDALSSQLEGLRRQYESHVKLP